MPSTTVFTLASGRSGTHFLYQLIRNNACDCVARHETYGYNPSMFGGPIYDHAIGDYDRTRRLLGRKRRIVDRCAAGTYVETSHAFLKSWFKLALDFFPHLKLIHLIRDPLKVAKSEAVREQLIKRCHIPFCHYRAGDGHRYFLWSLTGREPIFQHFDQARLTRFQWYVIQWIEIENRAIQFLDHFDKHADCISLHSPADLNTDERICDLFDFLGLNLRLPQLILTGRQNKNWRPTTITNDDRREFNDVVSSLPPNYLEIFQSKPYTSLPWITDLLALSNPKS